MVRTRPKPTSFAGGGRNRKVRPRERRMNMNKELHKPPAELPLFEVPNLDGLSVDPDELLGASHVFYVLHEYARCKAGAMRHRVAGDINAARYLEAECDRLYNILPKWARW